MSLVGAQRYNAEAAYILYTNKAEAETKTTERKQKKAMGAIATMYNSAESNVYAIATGSVFSYTWYTNTTSI